MLLQKMGVVLHTRIMMLLCQIVVVPISDFILLRKGGIFVRLFIILNTEVEMMNIFISCLCVNKSPIRQNLLLVYVLKFHVQKSSLSLSIPLTLSSLLAHSLTRSLEK